jgi:predicted Ser/Thr protein kinase
MEKFHTVDVAALRPGTEVGAWRVVTLGGQGSYGVVYRAEPIGAQGAGPGALKVALHPRDERFEREVELLSRLRSPHVPRLLESGTWTAPEGARFPYLVMEWVEGVPLYEWAKRHKLTSRKAMKVLAQVARAVAATHEVEGVHRDVKGDNVLVTERGHAVLMDFGSGCYRGARVLTGPRVSVGTPRYWSPEALMYEYRFSRRVSARYQAGPADDVYALGVMAYRLVTGEYPPDALIWEEEGAMPRLASAKHVRPEERVTVSPELADLIRQMLSEQPSARGSAAQVAQALEQAEKTAGRKANRRLAKVQARDSAEQKEPRDLRRAAVAWLGWPTAAALGLALAVRGSAPEYPAPVEAPAQVAEVTQGVSGSSDGGTTALGDSAHAAQGEAELPKSERPDGVGAEMPKTPFPGQRLPPCEKPEVEIRGGCWVGLRDASPPCGPRSYEWNNGCYWPSMVPRRPDTSQQP